MILGFSLNKGISDEFIRREFDIDITYGNVTKKSREGERLVFILKDEDINEVLGKLNQMINDSVVIILIGSETLNLQVIRKLAKQKNIHRIFVQYLDHPSFLFGLLATIRFVLDCPGAMRSNLFYKSLYRGLKRYLKMSYIEFRYDFDYFPLGYSNSFVESLQKSQKYFEPDYSGSLFSLMENFPDFQSRNNGIAFVGSLTGPCRKLVLSHVEKFLKSEIAIHINQKWGFGDSPDELKFLDAITSFKFALCLPGHVSNQTFRFFEALICGSLPLETLSSPQDWSRKLPGVEVGLRGFSYKSTWSRLKNLNDTELTAILKQLRIEVGEELHIAREKLHQAAKFNSH